MSTLLETAEAAAAEQDWPKLLACLGQMMGLHPSAQLTPTIAPAHANRPLHLALQILDEGDFHARWDVAKLLPNFGPQVIPALIDRLHNSEEETETRWFAARILGQFDQPQAIQALIAAMQDENPELSTMASEALAQSGPTVISALGDRLTHPDTRGLAVRALAQIRHPETIPWLLSVVTDADASIRAIAVEALSSFQDDRIPRVLLDSLKDPAASVRQVAVIGLGLRRELADRLELVTHLGDRLWDINLEVCQQAALALSRIGTDAAAALLFRSLKSPNTPIALQQELIRALGWMNSEVALEYLQRTVSSLVPDDLTMPLYQEIVTLLGRWADPTLKPQVAQILVDLLHSEAATQYSTMLRPPIALSLGQLGQPEQIDGLIELLADPDFTTRLHAIAALKQINAPLAKQRLDQVIQQPNLPSALRDGVAIALQEWG